MTNLPNFTTQSWRTHRGFTMVELMVVLVILGVMVSVVALSVQGGGYRQAMGFAEQLSRALPMVARHSRATNNPVGVVIQDNQLQVVAFTGIADDDKNLMELSVNLNERRQSPWQDIGSNWLKMPPVPNAVSVEIDGQVPSLSAVNAKQTPAAWVSEPNAPKIIWYGNHGASKAVISVHYEGALIAQIIVNADGSVVFQSKEER
ncbi:MAG: prepilin-type N-terminal cleavage/methylation domain-containing protein [Moraxella sp.]|nr:prepilin-type N-terminal cleavage/methylation domain-containing protein [Moraxella sp.]